MEYIILSDTTRYGLADLVNNAIQDGWEPQGGVSFELTRLSMDGGGSNASGRFSQALIRRKK